MNAHTNPSEIAPKSQAAQLADAIYCYPVNACKPGRRVTMFDAYKYLARTLQPETTTSD